MNKRYLAPREIAVFTSYNVVTKGQNYNQATVVWGIGSTGLTHNNSQWQKPLSGGARGGFYIFKGMPDMERLTNLVDQLGTVSDAAITKTDMQTNENTMFFGDGILRRRPDRNLPNKTLLKKFYWKKGWTAPNLDGSQLLLIQLPSSRYTIEHHIQKWNEDRPAVDWFFTGSGAWGLTVGRTIGNRWGDVI